MPVVFNTDEDVKVLPFITSEVVASPRLSPSNQISIFAPFLNIRLESFFNEKVRRLLYLLKLLLSVGPENSATFTRFPSIFSPLT